MINLIQTTRIASSILASFLLFGTHQIAQAAEITSQTLRYSVKHTKQNAGELEVIIERQGNSVKTTAISHLSAIAKMFLSGQTIESWFELNDNGAEVSRGNILGHDSNSITNSFEVDKAAGVIRYQNKEDEPIVEGDYFESTSFPIGLMASDINSIEGTTIREINPKKSRYYVYQQPVEESLEINGKIYDVWKIVRNKRGDPNRIVTFWLDKTTHIPLQINSSKKGKDTVLKLINPS